MIRKKITGFPRNGIVTKAGRSRSNSAARMAASPGNMYQKQALKKRPTSYLQPTSGSVSKSDKYKEKDIPLNQTQPPPSPRASPTIDRSNISLRKFSQISLNSETSDTVDANSNGTLKPSATKKNAIRIKHHQVGSNEQTG